MICNKSLVSLRDDLCVLRGLKSFNHKVISFKVYFFKIFLKFFDILKSGKKFLSCLL